MLPLWVTIIRRWARIIWAVALVVCGATELPAADFSITLSPEQQERCGLSQLTPQQQTSLNSLVARELLAARQGGVRAFAGTFISRRTADERQQAGLDQLTPAEQDGLNELVSEALAQQQPPPMSVSMLRQPNTQTEETPSKLKVHGSVAFVYGTGRDGSYRGASVYTEVTDPDRKMALGIGVATISGNGTLLRRCYYDRFDSDYCHGWGW